MNQSRLLIGEAWCLLRPLSNSSWSVFIYVSIFGIFGPRNKTLFQLSEMNESSMSSVQTKVDLWTLVHQSSHEHGDSSSSSLVLKNRKRDGIIQCTVRCCECWSGVFLNAELQISAQFGSARRTLRHTMPTSSGSIRAQRKLKPWTHLGFYAFTAAALNSRGSDSLALKKGKKKKKKTSRVILSQGYFSDCGQTAKSTKV